MANKTLLNDLFPEAGRLLLTGGGKEFVERIGLETIREAIHNVMMGENVRTQTEPLSRRRIAIVSGAVVAMFANGFLGIEDFSQKMSEIAAEQIANSKRNDKASIWVAQWLIGLTGKSVQNVLRSDPAAFEQYISDFDDTIAKAAETCGKEFGDFEMTLGYLADGEGGRVELNWRDIARLTTAIGSQTLTIRGSDKSMFGKLFERLILGSYLSILGFERVNPANPTGDKGVFWLSDSSDNRESDATLLLRPGKLARFDIGFIGPGNSEISKDKLSRYAREMEFAGVQSSSVTFIVVDRLPRTSKTLQAAAAIEAEIVQMSMKFWVKELAIKLGERLGVEHELQTMQERDISDYLAERLATIPVQDFLSGVSVGNLLEEE